MQEPRIPDNEAERLDALRRLNLLDTAAEARFDRITRIAQRHFQVPIALVSLVDKERQWFKSKQGLDACETSRGISFCGHAILSEEIFSIPNALEDPRFADNPLVTDGPKIRFYAGAPLHAPNGHRIGTLCIIDDKPRAFSTEELVVLRDLADAVEAELERGHLLRAQVELSSFKHVLDRTLDMIFMFDTRTLKFNYVNDGARQSMGYTQDELLQMHPYDIKPEIQKEKFEQLIAPLLAGEKQVLNFETLHRHKDGHDFPVSIALQIVRSDGEADRFVAIVRDITERKRLDRLKSEFISTVSHELRTPLTSIRGALGLVLGKATGGIPEKAQLMLGMAERNCDRLTLLINDLLDLDKIESGRLEVDLKPADLLELAKRALEDNEGYARQHNVTLRLHTDLMHAPIQGDAHRLLQVFANLISNAVKFSPQGSEVVISVSQRGDHVRATVRDQGAGIPEHFRDRIFQRFAQADSSDTRQKGGTGLGLSITKAIVERHNGKIEYETELGKGTAFHFDLPVFHASLIGTPDSASGVRVLVCEDNPDVATILAAMLEQKGINSDIAASAEAARTLLATQAYRMLMLDLSLPDADGIQFLQELRSVPATADLPVIIVSGRAEEGRIGFTGDGVAIVDWIQKPVKPARLEAALREALRRNNRPRILHVEDDADIIQIAQSLLSARAEFSHVATVHGARSLLGKNDYDLVILDLGLTDGSGLDLLDELKGRCPVMIFSGQNPDGDVSGRVHAALTKSMTSNEQFVETIQKILNDQTALHQPSSYMQTCGSTS